MSFKTEMKMYGELSELLDLFDAITLESMDKTRLMDRVETKFVFHGSHLPEILAELTKSYRVLEIDKLRIFSYKSLYLDTPEFRMYHDHHRGKRNRVKVRYRQYLDTHQTFLEEKFKTNTRHTIKKRIPVSEVENPPSDPSWAFISSGIGWADHNLEPKLWTSYKRFTLVHRNLPERITIDVQLSVSNENQSKNFPYLVIAEVKQESRKNKSDFIELLIAKNIKPSGLSKYCLGCVLLYPDVKNNLYKQKIRSLSHIVGNEPEPDPSPEPAAKLSVLRS